ncbi:MAG: arsenite methyltransferase [Candidatus Latescibacterota bacterium]|nr:MAG: arsenite methyltransferase [Candidatus Latescibacterota bacterium]
MLQRVPKRYHGTPHRGGTRGEGDYLIRPCRREDLKVVSDLVAGVELCSDGIEDQFGEAYVLAEASGKVIACAGIETHGSHGLLRSVAVVPEKRGLKIGKTLVVNRLEWAKSRGIGAVYLLTVTAADYFEALGFERTGRSDTPPEIQKTHEFSEACPETADVMVFRFGGRGNSREVHAMDIKKEVRDKYADAARKISKQTGGPAGEKKKASCCGSERSAGAQEAITSGLYDPSELKNVPADAALASLGCGNPTALAELKPGESVLDLGSGGGIDVLLSAKRVGPTGMAYGVDMTDEMLEVARENQRKAGVENVEFLKGEIEKIPLPDGAVDVVISNCVINLSPDKRRVLREAFRVLKPGGRLAVSDIVARGQIPDAIRRDMELWTGCIAGALEENEYRSILEEAGFQGIELQPTRLFRVEKGCCGDAQIEVSPGAAGDEIDVTFMSAFIRASKPTQS